MADRRVTTAPVAAPGAAAASASAGNDSGPTLAATTAAATTTAARRSVEAALAANRRLQRRVLSDLREASRRKKENRAEAEACWRGLQLLQWEGRCRGGATGGDDDDEGAPPAAGTDVPSAHDLGALFAAPGGGGGGGGGRGSESGNDNDATTTTNNNNNNNSNKIRESSTRFRQKRHRLPFRYDPKRKWAVEFFVDPTGSRPDENPDVAKRRRGTASSRHADCRGGTAGEGKEQETETAAASEAAHGGGTSEREGVEDGASPGAAAAAPAGGFFFHHSSPPYGKQERARLDELLSLAWCRGRSGGDGPDPGGGGAEDPATPQDQPRTYHDVARMLQDAGGDGNGGTTSRGQAAAAVVARTARDVRLYHQHRVASSYEFSEQQSARMLDLVRTQLQQRNRVLKGTPGPLGPGEKTGGGEDVPNGDHGDDHDHDHDDTAIANRGGVRRETAPGTTDDGRLDWGEISDTLLREYHHQSELPPNVGAGLGGGNDDAGDDGSKTSDRTGGAAATAPPPPPPITPYRCMVHYKTRLRGEALQIEGDGSPEAGDPTSRFTREEDELLLRYMAAMGPQFVWDVQQISHLAARLFPGKTAKRLYERTTFSLWNPLAVAGASDRGGGDDAGVDYGGDVDDRDAGGLYWTRSEEQKLLLAMKIYGGSGNRDGGDDEGCADEWNGDSDRICSATAATAAPISAIRRAAAHFYPQRPTDRVARKWERSLDPRLSNRPFSRHEDATLLDAVRTSAPSESFGDIARERFPSRSRAQVYQRWKELATAQHADDESHGGSGRAPARSLPDLGGRHQRGHLQHDETSEGLDPGGAYCSI